MSAANVRTLANRFVRGTVDAPTSMKDARLMVAKVRTGRAASRNNGIAHHIIDAAICSDGDTATLAARWACGGGSVNAMVANDDHPVTCRGCAEAIRHPRGPVIYRCFDASGTLLYIGSTSDLMTRIKGHRVPSGSYWWPQVADIRATPQVSAEAARTEEARAIAVESPKYNRIGTAKWVRA